MEDVVRIKEHFYVLAASSFADERTRVLKHGDMFAVFNRLGDIESIGMGQPGLYFQGTRYLSRFVVRLGDEPPQLLRSSVCQDNAFLTMDMMNLDISEDGGVSVPRGSLHLFRSQFLWNPVCYQHLRISNYSLQRVQTFIVCEFESDFADIFEVRGTKREKRGEMLPVDVTDDTVAAAYEGRDGKLRRATLHFGPRPDYLGENEARFSLSLEPKQEASLYFTVSCEGAERRARRSFSFGEALHERVEALHHDPASLAKIVTSNRRFNEWVARSDADLQMMISGNPEGAYPYAGVPWFNTVFGRDGILTAMECLWIAPWMAKSVLRFLAQHQATEVNPEQEAEPGKILHEMRRGEMAALKEVPFGCYYGSIDATPLFVMLAGAYWERTRDYGFLQTIWPNILAALQWIDRYGDLDRDGFLEYQPRTTKGLVQQGWKDSHDSISHADGSLAELPIALCEVQAYAYAAKRAAAGLAESFGQEELSRELLAQSELLRDKFEREFWSDELNCYVLALDGHKKQCRVRSSNIAHCLFAGIAGKEHATAVMNTLMSRELFCGWGIRTLGSSEVRYNPMSYHNGSVWPHDNAFAARGLARYKFHNEALKITYGLLDASTFMEHNRLPELFCGFHRRSGEGPTLYPVACSPQAWASGAVYLLIQACLGIEVRSEERSIRLAHPYLPDILDDMRIENLPIGQGSVDLVLRRRPTGGIVPEILRQDSTVEIQTD